MNNIPTKEEVIEIAEIHPLKVKNIYMFGSRVYGTARDNSDYDFILVGSNLLAKDEKKTDRINVHIHTTDVFKDELFNHDIHNLECYFAPEWAKLQMKEPFSSFQLNPKKLVKSVLAESFSSWHKAKINIYDGNISYGVKSLWHSIRMLTFGIDILQNGKITKWDAENNLWFTLKECDEFEWSYFKNKYFEYKIDLENKLKTLGNK